jgi:aryl-alcohol dehydrogenase-like predicted oxidoreductase
MDSQRIILGCGNFGGIGSNPLFFGKGDDASAADAILDLAKEVGITRFDTANTYGGGASETILGQWLLRQSSDYRSRVQISTKVGNPNGATEGQAPLSRAQIKTHLDQSLKRLRVDYVETYYLHELDPMTPIEETQEELREALKAGKIRSIGLSNIKRADLSRFLATADSFLRDRTRWVQNEFN